MNFYVKKKDVGVRQCTMDDVRQQLSEMSPVGLTPPYLVVYFDSDKTNYLFTLKENLLCRYPLRKDSEKNIYCTIPGYFEYDASNALISSVLSRGRFTTETNFSIPEDLLITEAQLVSLPTQSSVEIDESERIACPYLEGSPLSREQQEELYFGYGIKSCDTFHRTLQTFIENFDDPVKILSAVFLTDEALVGVGLESDIKKVIQRLLLPFFLPEGVNRIRGLQDVKIGSVMNFYFHCVHGEIDKIYPSYEFRGRDLKIFSSDSTSASVGDLPEDYVTQTSYWQKPAAVVDETLISPNAEIIQCLSLVFGVNVRGDRGDVQSQLAFVRSMFQRYDCNALEHILQALQGYRETLSDKDHQLHFQSRYHVSYDHLSALYPIPDTNTGREMFLRLVNIVMSEAEYVFASKRLVERLDRREHITLSVNELNMLTLFSSQTRLRELFSSNRYVVEAVTNILSNSRRFEQFLRQLSVNQLKQFFSLLVPNLEQGEVYRMLDKLSYSSQLRFCQEMPISVMTNGMGKIADFFKLMKSVEYSQKALTLDTFLQSRHITQLTMSLSHIREIYSYCFIYGGPSKQTQFINAIKGKFSRMVSNVGGLVNLLRHPFSEADQRLCLSGVSLSVARCFNNIADFNLFASHFPISDRNKQQVYNYLIQAHNAHLQPQQSSSELFVRSPKPDSAVVFLAGLNLIAKHFYRLGGAVVLSKMARVYRSARVSIDAVLSELTRLLRAEYSCYSPSFRQAVNTFVTNWQDGTCVLDINEICQTPVSTWHVALSRPQAPLVRQPRYMRG